MMGLVGSSSGQIMRNEAFSLIGEDIDDGDCDGDNEEEAGERSVEAVVTGGRGP
jgi:hypothetical protein